MGGQPANEETKQESTLKTAFFTDGEGGGAEIRGADTVLTPDVAEDDLFKPLLQWRPRLLSLCNFHSAVTARRESAGDSNSVSYQLSPRKKGFIGVYLLRPVYLWILQGKMDFARFDLIYHK